MNLDIEKIKKQELEIKTNEDYNFHLGYVKLQPLSESLVRETVAKAKKFLAENMTQVLGDFTVSLNHVKIWKDDEQFDVLSKQHYAIEVAAKSRFGIH
jgi:hypothetical protein